MIALFMIACALVVAAALIAEAMHPKGVLVVPPDVWLAALVGLGLWLVALVLGGWDVFPGR